MPETDWLTGLSSRAAFARQVRQADRDRDQFAVAIVGIRRIEEINRRLGFDIGDELLRTVGRALGGQTAVGTTIARLGGAQFGVMTVGDASEDMTGWCEPVVSGVDSALNEWTFERIDFDGECPIQPELVMGAAGGFSGRVWADAALALDLAEAEAEAEDHPGRSRLIIHDPADPRLLDRRKREDLSRLVDGCLDEHSMVVGVQEIEVVGRPNPGHRWIRVVARDPSPAGSAPLDAGRLAPAVGRRLERWIAEEAAALISSHTGQLRATIAVMWELDTGPAFIERLMPVLDRVMVPPSRLIFEVDEGALSMTGARGQAFVESVVSAGSCLVLAGCDGGHRTAKAAVVSGIQFVKPAEALTRAAVDGDRAARRVVEAISHIAVDTGRELIAPASIAEDRCLNELGVTYVERQATTSSAVLTPHNEARSHGSNHTG